MFHGPRVVVECLKTKAPNGDVEPSTIPGAYLMAGFWAY